MPSPLSILSSLIGQDTLDNIINKEVGGYGMRHNGSAPKGLGYFGELSDGNSNTYMTELSADNDEMHFPLITPGQSFKDLSNVLTGGVPTSEMYRKAIEHAMSRTLTGRDPFSQIEEPHNMASGMHGALYRYIRSKEQE